MNHGAGFGEPHRCQRGGNTVPRDTAGGLLGRIYPAEFTAEPLFPYLTFPGR